MSENSSDDLEAIKARKMQELKRRLAATQAPQNQQKKNEVDDLTLVRSNLINRGTEVIDAALAQYPKAAQEVVRHIANLYRMGKLKEPIPGEEIIALFQDLGMRVHLNTTITYVKDGKRVPLSEKFKEKKTEPSE